MIHPEDARIAVIGLGYVGLPLAVEFAGRYPVVGFDTKRERIDELRAGHDRTLEVTPAELAGARGLTFTGSPDGLHDCNVYIVTVPTPIDAGKRPDLTALIGASETVGGALQEGDVVIYESTVYPGCTEDECVPVLERTSGLRYVTSPVPGERGWGGFFVGYSPERVNPGDRDHRIATIIKVTSGSTPETAEFVDGLYASIVTAGTHRVSSIRVAEAAKVIENTQRDVNIALINELAMLFARLGIDTTEVLEAAGTKWNFLPFRPGLVGGHCIGVDPYYLTHKAQEIGHHPEMILAGRRVNDGMGAYIATRLIKLMAQKGTLAAGARVLIMGFTFKENCPDLRNTRVIDIVRELRGYELEVDVHDPWIDPGEAREEYGIEPVAEPAAGAYDAVVLAVAHDRFREMGTEPIRALGRPGAILFDVKGALHRGAADGRL